MHIPNTQTGTSRTLLDLKTARSLPATSASLAEDKFGLERQAIGHFSSQGSRSYIVAHAIAKFYHSYPVSTPTTHNRLGQQAHTAHDAEADCTVCSAGKYLGDAGITATAHDAEADCTICGAGTYTSSTGSASCTTCSAGKYLTDAGTSAAAHDSLEDCTNCPVGTALADDGTSADHHDHFEDCAVYEAGTFSNVQGAQFCEVCPHRRGR